MMAMVSPSVLIPQPPNMRLAVQWPALDKISQQYRAKSDGAVAIKV
jgi:hypothetical protein